MNDKNRQRHIAYEVLVILGQLALLTYITRLWPILLLVILGIFVAAYRLDQQHRDHRRPISLCALYNYQQGYL